MKEWNSVIWHEKLQYHSLIHVLEELYQLSVHGHKLSPPQKKKYIKYLLFNFIYLIHDSENYKGNTEIDEEHWTLLIIIFSISEFSSMIKYFTLSEKYP